MNNGGFEANTVVDLCSQTTAKTMPWLPPELIDLVIDHLRDTDNNVVDLRACALVCKAWVVPARSRLFREVRISPFYGTQFQAIQETPALAAYVRVFHARHLSSLYYYKSVIQLLPLFTRLRKLVLFDIRWTLLQRDTRDSFRRVLALPHLIDLEVMYVVFDKREHFEDLLHPHLKRLAVFESKWEGTPHNSVVDDEIEPRGRQPCHLDYLNYDSRPVFVDWLLGTQTTIDLANLRSLNVHVQSVSRLLQALESLDHLQILIVDRCMSPHTHHFYISFLI
jgi:hypothetical protein